MIRCQSGKMGRKARRAVIPMRQHGLAARKTSGSASFRRYLMFGTESSHALLMALGRPGASPHQRACPSPITSHLRVSSVLHERLLVRRGETLRFKESVRLRS